MSYPVIFGGQTVQSVMYEIDVTGYDNQCNTLKLFDLDTVDESIVEGDGINFDKEDIRRNLTLFFVSRMTVTIRDNCFVSISNTFMVSNGSAADH